MNMALAFLKSQLDVKYDAVIAAVGHRQFVGLSPLFWSSLIKNDGILLDLKAVIPRSLNPFRL